MVKSTDLRIGNYVRDIVSNELMIVDEIGKNIGATLLNNDKYPLPEGWQMGYVPLTPELLEQLGFRKDCINTRQHLQFGITVTDTSYLLEDESMHFFEIVEVRCDSEVVYNHREKKNIKYMHQVQNLYFITSDEELPVNIPQPA